jgi:ABC-type Mn2+/Zn2+ transport systems, permease components
MIDILLSAFLLSVVLLGIHSYFGLEIIKRGIIFTDLAIGQMSALGAALSILFFDGLFIYPLSLAFALLAGLAIAIAAKRTVSHEAFIGLLYAFGISGVFIILSKSAHGMEMFDKLMASDILFTPWADIIETAVIYSLLGLLLVFVYPRMKGFWKDTLFFVSFAATVTSSVRLAGVLIVFALLVAPAYVALRINKGKLLLTAWIIGTAVNLVSILVSYNLDLPTGYTLVFFHALLALSVSILFPVTKKKEQEAT